MCVFLTDVDKKDLRESTSLLRDILKKIELEDQFTPDSGLDFFQQLTLLIHFYKNHIFSVLQDKKLVDSTKVAFLTSLVEEASGSKEPKPLSPYIDMFGLETTEYSMKTLSEKDIGVLKQMKSMSADTFVQNLAKVRSFGDMVIISKLLFGIE